MGIVISSSSRPPSVGVDYGYCTSLKKVFVPQRQRRLWLMSPMRESRSLSHWLQVWQVGMNPGMLAFRLALFSLAVVRIFSSPDFNCLRRTLRNLLRSRVFMSRLQTSLKRSWGRPTVLLPQASSSLRMSLGIWLSSIRRTWPSHCSLLCLSSINMVERPARSRTGMLRMRRRKRMWTTLRDLGKTDGTVCQQQLQV